MIGTTMKIEQTEQEILAFEVSDEALEAAAGTANEKANFTLGASVKVLFKIGDRRQSLPVRCNFANRRHTGP